MADSSVAPKERVNITYKATTGDGSKDIELPNKLLVVGDFTLREEEDDLEKRAKISVNKDNFNDVMQKQNLSLQFTVKDRLSEPVDDDEDDQEMVVDLNIDNINSFNPESVVQQVPELQKLLQLRDALSFLKGPLGNIPAFRKQMDKLLEDSASRDQLMKELGLVKPASDSQE